MGGREREGEEVDAGDRGSADEDRAVKYDGAERFRRLIAGCVIYRADNAQANAGQPAKPHRSHKSAPL